MKVLLGLVTTICPAFKPDKISCVLASALPILTSTLEILRLESLYTQTKCLLSLFITELVGTIRCLSPLTTSTDTVKPCFNASRGLVISTLYL
ncbi:hypothetical protein SAL_1435 [Streptococcus agalactiae 515]|nr:hypothetical protein SAL_1435 [Streptococcus agalactiae 515]